MTNEYENLASRILWEQALRNNKVVYQDGFPVRTLSIAEIEQDEHLRNYVSKYATMPEEEDGFDRLIGEPQ